MPSFHQDEEASTSTSSVVAFNFASEAACYDSTFEDDDNEVAKEARDEGLRERDLTITS
jgi:hypothetical protein